MMGTNTTPVGEGLTFFDKISFEIFIINTENISVVGFNCNALRRRHPLLGLFLFQSSEASSAGDEMIVVIVRVMIQVKN